MSESAVPEAISDLVDQIKKGKLPPAPYRRRIREGAGVSKRAAARTLGVDVMTISRWEEGATPRRENAIAYRQLLDALEGVAS
jgi:DNA-binding transcriptional regulator YiaG